MHAINVKLVQVQMVSDESISIPSITHALLSGIAHFLWIFFLLHIFIGAQAIRSRSAQVTVLVPPENPKIVKDGNMSIDEIVATEDREIELECISSGGKPAAEVSKIFWDEQKKMESFVCEEFSKCMFFRDIPNPIIINLISNSFILWNAISNSIAFWLFTPFFFFTKPMEFSSFFIVVVKAMSKILEGKITLVEMSFAV